jgi:hypothetical protein
MSMEDTLKLEERDYFLFLNRKDIHPILLDTPPSFSYINKRDSLKEFDIAFTKIQFDYIDTTLFIEGEIIGIEKYPRLPNKNVLIIIGDSFITKYIKRYTTISYVNNNFGELIDSIPYYQFKEYEMGYSLIESESQKFSHSFKIKPNSKFLIFAHFEYKLQVFDLQRIIPEMYFSKFLPGSP